jgi:hypothetical protein
MRFRSIVVLLLALAVVAGAVRRYRTPAGAAGEHEKPVVPPSDAPAPRASPSPAGPPARAEVQPALDRVFDRALAVDDDAAPPFAAGDFNGDGVGDLAVAVRPRGPAAARDRLLAFVHGVDPGGWRNPEAREGHLVKTAAGPSLRARPLSGLPDRMRMEVTRAHAGDFILVDGGGPPRAIVWTGAAYAAMDF